MTIVDLIGGEKPCHLPTNMQWEASKNHDNLLKFKQFYQSMAKGHEAKMRILKLPEDLAKNAAHSLLFTIKLDGINTDETLE